MMVPGSDYKDARDATIRAAHDLYPSGPNCARVQTTWTALKVGVNAYDCAGPITPSTGPNKVLNPGFEATPNGKSWTQSSTGIINDFGGIGRSGTKNAYLRGLGSAGTDSISQQLKVPNVAAPKLVFYLLVDSSDSTADAYDTFKAQIISGGTTTTVMTSSNQVWDDSYHRVVVNLAQFKNKTVTLKFVGTEDVSGQTGFLLDDISVR